MLILICVFICLFISTLSSKWISFLIILLFLGGMIVLFVYICTLISRIKTSVQNLGNRVRVRILVTLILRSLFIINYWDSITVIKNLYLSIIYRNSNFLLMILIITYLLLVLVTRIKLCQKFKGGIKSKIYD